MRSRLDEIVEEEMAVCVHPKKWWTLSDSAREFGQRIADRSFRHGAERHALWVKSVGEAAANVVPKMVPAPAEEKPAKGKTLCRVCAAPVCEQCGVSVAAV